MDVFDVETQVSDAFLRWSEEFDDLGAEATVVVRAGQRVLLDENADIGTLIVDGGELIVEDIQDLVLSADRVLVMDGGLFQVGTEDTLFQHRFTLVLTGDDGGFDTVIAPYRDMAGGPDEITDNDAYLMAMGAGSRIEIHAADATRESWTQLRQTAEAGDTWLYLSETTDWRAGDRIAVASTGVDMNQAEQRTIAEVRDGGRQIRLEAALAHRHHGEVETYDNGLRGDARREWDIDMRAEVALLSRNVVITGDENADQDHFGGHIMVMHHGEMRIEGAEITRMGQEGVLGRYGAHWHLSGDAAGDYLRNNSFHQIYNRGITLHGVQNALVSDNVVFETIGHGIFMEDATEFGNRLIGNLGFGTRAADPATALGSADVDHVSTFWIENPNNTIEGNHAAGSEFAGFWIAPSDPHGPSAATGAYDHLTGRTDPIAHFVGNAAHSNPFNLGIEGHVADGEGRTEFKTTRYEATADWQVRDFTAFKSAERSIWTRTLGGTFTDIKSADNARATFFSYTSTLEDSVIVGRSWGNADPADPTGHHGHSIYDGPSGIRDVHFANFNGADRAIQLATAAEKSTTHFASGITFDGVAEANRIGFHVVEFQGANGPGVFDHEWTTSLIDLDGSISGVERATITAMIDGPDGTKVNTSPDAVARAEWNAWVGTGAEIGWMRIVPSTDFPASQAASPDTKSTWYDIARSDGVAILNSRPTSDVMINAAVAVQDDLSYRIRLHELPNTMTVAFNGLSQGTAVEYTYQNLPAGSVVTGAVEVVDRAALAVAQSTAFFRDNNDLVFRIVADRPMHLTPDTDDAYMLGRTWGTWFRIETGLANDSPNVLADFEQGVDSRTATSADGAAIGPVRTAWNDRDDAINWWDVTANGDGVLGHGDFHLTLGEAQNWAAVKRLTIDTALGGAKADYEVLLHDASDGLIGVGRFGAGMARIYLDDIEARYLDQIDDVVIRVHEADMTADADLSGPFSRVHLLGIHLEAGDGPRFQLDGEARKLTTTSARDVLLTDTRGQAGSDSDSVNSIGVSANGDGIWGHGDLRLAINNENWHTEDWLRIDTAITGIQAGYTVHLRDRDDGWIRVGDGTSGVAMFDLSGIADRRLDRVADLIIRVEEKSLATDAHASVGFTHIDLRSIDTLRGAITVADFETGVDARTTTDAHGAAIGPVRAAWQDREDSINWWDVTANGDGVSGYGDFHLRLGGTHNWAPFGTLEIDTILGGVKTDFDVLLHDATDGPVHAGRFGSGVARIYLDDIEARYLDEIDDIVIRVHESDLSPDANEAGAFTRVHLYGIHLDGRTGPRFDFADGADWTTHTTARNATVGAVGHDPDFLDQGAMFWDIAADGDGTWGVADLHFATNSEDWRNAGWLHVDAAIGGALAGYSVYLTDRDDGTVLLGQAGGSAWFDLASVEDRFLDRVGEILIRVNERDLAAGVTDVSAASRIHLKCIDVVRGAVTLADFDGGVDPRGTLHGASAGFGDIRSAWGDTVNWWDVASNGDSVSGQVDYRLAVDEIDLSTFGGLTIEGMIGGVQAGFELLVRDRDAGLVSLGRYAKLEGSIDLGAFDADLIDWVDQIVFRVYEQDVQADPDSDEGLTRMHLGGISLSARPGPDLLQPLVPN